MIFKEIFYENLQLPNELLSVRQAGELLKDASYSISRDKSPTHTIGFLRTGKLNITSDDKKCVLQCGQSVFFPRDISYSIMSDQNDPPHFLWVNLRGKLIDELAQTLFCGTYTISEAILSRPIAQLRELLSDKNACWTEISSLVFKMLLEIYSAKSAATPVERQYSKYELYISNSIQSGFSVSAMAEYFHCSTDTINRLFQKKYGVTPYQYYQNMRIEIARTMLCQTELTLEDIAERLHFTDRNHFSLCFKKITGYAPVKYKKIQKRLA